MYFGESAINESLRMKKYLSSEVIKNLRPEDVNDKQKMKKVIYEIQKEHDKKAQSLAIKYLIGYCLETLLIPVCGIGAILFLIDTIIIIVESNKLSSTPTGQMVDRARNTLGELRKNGADNKRIEACEKLIAALEDVDYDQRTNRPNVNIYSY